MREWSADRARAHLAVRWRGKKMGSRACEKPLPPGVMCPAQKTNA